MSGGYGKHDKNTVERPTITRTRNPVRRTARLTFRVIIAFLVHDYFVRTRVFVFNRFNTERFFLKFFFTFHTLWRMVFSRNAYHICLYFSSPVPRLLARNRMTSSHVRETTRGKTIITNKKKKKIRTQ